MRLGEYDFDRRSLAGVDVKSGMQGAAEALDEAHSQGFASAGLVIFGQSDPVVCDAQGDLSREPLFKGYVDPSGSVMREGVFYGVRDGFVNDHSHRDRLGHVQRDGIEVQVEDNVFIGHDSVTQGADDVR